MTKAKKMTFRQRLRVEAGEILDGLCNIVSGLASEVVAEESKINSADVMRLLSGGQTKSLRHRLITELANEKEAKLEALYNRQQQLPMGDDNADES